MTEEYRTWYLSKTGTEPEHEVHERMGRQARLRS